MLDIPYEQQLACKRDAVRDAFAGIAADACACEVIGMDEPYAYRDKIASPVTRDRRCSPAGTRVLTGMYQDGTHRIVPIERCPVENPLGQKVIHAIKRIMERHRMEPYDEDAGQGFVRHIVVRIGHESGEVLVTIVTNGREFPHARSFCKELRKQVPEVTSIVQNVNERRTNVILGEEEHILSGPGFILDGLCGLSFRISSRSFYQVNARMTSVLYRKAIELADVAGAVVIDAYCGTGTLGLVAARMGAKRIIGVDSVREAIVDARANARHNGIDNAEFFAEDATGFMSRMAACGREAKERLVVLLDPPRAGSTPAFIEAATSLAPDAIVYVSCNPKSQRRDAELFLERGYRIDKLACVDMFPHTEHIECIARLAREGS